MGAYTCDVCRLDGGWHYDENGTPSRCPSRYATAEVERVERVVADQHTEAFKAAKDVLRDAAAAMPELDANRIRDLFEKADIPRPLRGSAVRWAANEGGLLEPTGRRVMSTESTTRHRVEVWRSRVYGKRWAS